MSGSRHHPNHPDKGEEKKNSIPREDVNLHISYVTTAGKIFFSVKKIKFSKARLCVPVDTRYRSKRHILPDASSATA